MIGELLKERTDAIVERWVEVVLSSYPSVAAVLFHKEKDSFANPIGGTVRRGTRGIFETILNGMDSEALRSHLDEIVRVRAVQELTPSKALAFVLSLRSIVREVIPELEADPRFHREVAELDEKIDRVVLTAFDVYTECREEVSKLRVNEVKRQVAWAFEKMNQSNADDSVQTDALFESPAASENVQREDFR